MQNPDKLKLTIFSGLEFVFTNVRVRGFVYNINLVERSITAISTTIRKFSNILFNDLCVLSTGHSIPHLNSKANINFSNFLRPRVHFTIIDHNHCDRGKNIRKHRCVRKLRQQQSNTQSPDRHKLAKTQEISVNLSGAS